MCSLISIEVIKMLEPEMLVILSGVAVLPYAGEALWNWIGRKIRHRQGA